jgi:hypothetical protein
MMMKMTWQVEEVPGHGLALVLEQALGFGPQEVLDALLVDHRSLLMARYGLRCG